MLRSSSSVASCHASWQSVSSFCSASASIPEPIRTSWVVRGSSRARRCGTNRRNLPTACRAYRLTGSPAPKSAKPLIR